MNPPFPRSYWAIPGQILAGCYPGDLDAAQMDVKLDALLRSGVTLVVNLMEESETDHFGNPFQDYLPRLTELAQSRGQAVQMVRFPIRDQDIPTPAQMRGILSTIHTANTSGGVVYVHCWGGKGRTATVIGCYLIQRNLETNATILDRLKALTAHASKSFWPTPQTAEQGEFITNWNSVNSR